MMNKDNYIKAYTRDDYVCQICNSRATQIAHRIGQGKLNRKIYGDYIIDHVVNLKAVCSLSCNTKVDVTNNPVKREEVLKEVIYYDKDKK